MGIRRIVAAAFLAEILLSLGFGEGTAVRGLQSSSSSEVVSRHRGAARQEPLTSLVEARQRLVDYEKAYSEEKCISSGVCGKATGKVCAFGKCCTKEGYCLDDDSEPCSPLAQPQVLYSGDHCTDENELGNYAYALVQDKLVAREETTNGKAMTLAEAKKAFALADAKKAFDAAKKASDAAHKAATVNTNCTFEGECGRRTGKICAGQRCCTSFGYCWPIEEDVCNGTSHPLLEYSWPNCPDSTPAMDKYYEAKKKYDKAKATYYEAKKKYDKAKATYD